MKKIKILLKYLISLVFLGIPAFIIALPCKLFIKDYWLVSECGEFARDNGFFFFKYLREKHPEQKAIFVINKKSSDYQKVLSVGKVCHYKSFKHWFYYYLCKFEISSHPHSKPTYYLNKKLWANKTIFLQHGVTRDCVECYMKPAMNFKMFITASVKEDSFIRENFGHEDHVVKLLGFARHDNLINIQSNKNEILIMPTWRSYLRDVDDETFENSEYYKVWVSLMNNKRLLSILKEKNTTINFFLHRELQKYIHLFKPNNEYTKILSAQEYEVQPLLIDASLLITDYSSVFFDFAYMKKPVLWYMFDEEIYHKGHHNRGYFNERDNVLGKWSTTEKDLVDKIVCYIENDFKLSKKEIKDIEEFFPYFDGKCCERIYKEIKD